MPSSQNSRVYSSRMSPNERRARNSSPTCGTTATGWTIYPHYIREGYPISNAPEEGACRHVIGTRMKGSGRRLDDDGADAMARLRAVHCSGKWEAFHRERQHKQLQAVRELRKAA